MPHDHVSQKNIVAERKTIVAFFMRYVFSKHAKFEYKGWPISSLRI
jgi:hypothetical protein